MLEWVPAKVPLQPRTHRPTSSQALCIVRSSGRSLDSGGDTNGLEALDVPERLAAARDHGVDFGVDVAKSAWTESAAPLRTAYKLWMAN